MQDLPRHRRRSVASANDASEQATPNNAFLAGLIIGAIVGVICVILNVALTFAEAPFLVAVAHGGSAVTGNTWAAAGLGCLTFLINLFACFVAGLIAGKRVLQRSAGFYAGLLTGIIIYIASFLVRYIPNYPGNKTASMPVSAGVVTGGIVISIIFLIIWGFIGGLMGLWGSSTATKRLQSALPEE